MLFPESLVCCGRKVGQAGNITRKIMEKPVLLRSRTHFARAVPMFIFYFP